MEIIGLFILLFTSYFFSLRLGLFLFNVSNIMINGFTKKSMLLLLNNLIINIFGVKQVLFFIGLTMCIAGIFFVDQYVDIELFNLKLQNKVKLIAYYKYISEYANRGNQLITNNFVYFKNIILDMFPKLKIYNDVIIEKKRQYDESLEAMKRLKNSNINNLGGFNDFGDFGNMSTFNLKTPGNMNNIEALENMDIDKMLNDTLFNENFLKDFSNIANDFRSLMGKKRLSEDDANQVLNFSFKKSMDMLEPHMGNYSEEDNDENFRNLNDELNNLFKR